MKKPILNVFFILCVAFVCIACPIGEVIFLSIAIHGRGTNLMWFAIAVMIAIAIAGEELIKAAYELKEEA